MGRASVQLGCPTIGADDVYRLLMQLVAVIFVMNRPNYYTFVYVCSIYLLYNRIGYLSCEQLLTATPTP
jgi:hypothetical protein